jgi:hypothetical protein
MFGVYNGFDIVIGNPPYEQLQKEGGKLANLYQNCNYQTFERTGDIYALFYERGIEILKPGGHLCYISSNKWMRAAYGKKLRKYFTGKNPILLIDLGPDIFENATVDTSILLIQNKPNGNTTKALTLTREARDSNLAEFINLNAVEISGLSEKTWFIGSDAQQRLKLKIEETGKPLKDWNVNIYRGILTGLNEAFIIDDATKEKLCREDPCSAEILKPLLRGKDIKRYHYNWAGLWLVQTGYDLNIPKLYPAVYSHLLQYKAKAKQRDDQGKNWWNLRACVYYDEFEKEKIAWQEMAQHPQFTCDEQGYFCLDTCRILTGINIKYLTGFFNSKCFNYVFSKFYAGGGLGDKGVRYKSEFMKVCPIPAVTTENKHIVEKIEDLLCQISALKNQDSKADTTELEHQIDQLVYQLYDLTPDEIAIVEGNHFKT